MTITPSGTSTAIRRAWFAGTAHPRRAIWRRWRHVASEFSHLVGQVEFLFSLPRCWQSHATPGRWFFADISRGKSLVALRQPAEWSRSQSRIYLRQPEEWSWSQSRIIILAYACLRNIDKLWVLTSRHIWQYIWLRLLIVEAARPIRCIRPGLQYQCNACFLLEIVPRKSVTPSTMFLSTFIDASSGPVPRFWILVFWQEAHVPNVLRLPGNFRVLLTSDHQVLGQSPRRYLDYTIFTASIAC